MEGIPHTIRAAVDQLTRENPDLLMNEAKQVRELAESPGWLVIQRTVRRVRDLQEGILLQGEHSQAEYARIAGHMLGLDALLKVTEAIDQKAAQIDEARRQAVLNDQERQKAASGG